tara:strand:- start:622 stop:1092 length:471 start_codon:yes stop_codon:yes gene_type:complete
MRLPDLDERTVSVIKSILEHFAYGKPTERHFITHHVFSAIRHEHTDLLRTDIPELFNLIDELFDIGTNKPKEGYFTVDRTKLNVFMSNEGIHRLIPPTNSNNQEITEANEIPSPNPNKQLAQSNWSKKEVAGLAIETWIFILIGIGSIAATIIMAL